MATHFLPLSKNVYGTSIFQCKHLCQISCELVKNWGSSSRRKIFSPMFCHEYAVTQGNTVSVTVEKCVMHICTPRLNISAKFHENWSQTEEVVRWRYIGDLPPDRIGDRPPDDTLITIYPPYTLRVCGGITICWFPVTWPPKSGSEGRENFLF